MNREQMKSRADRMYSMALAKGLKREAEVMYHAANQLIEHDNSLWFRAIGAMNKMPVTIDEFIESDEFLGHGGGLTVWPTLRDDLRAYNPDVFTGAEPIHEIVDGGATGTGKTHKAIITQAYQLYLLTCFDNPVTLFPNLSNNTTIVMLFQSVQDRVTRRVIYDPFRSAFLGMPYSRRWVNHDKNKESTLVISLGRSAKVEVAPALAQLNAMVGQAIIGGIIDEVNFMAVVENSKNVPGSRGQGGHYDQAEIIHSNITRRRKGRFQTPALSIGALSVLSSTRYRGDFLDKRQASIKENNEKNVVMRRRAQYEVQPVYQDCTEWFDLLVGNTDYPTTILKPVAKRGVDYPEGGMVVKIPMSYYADFKRDPEGALRDVCGIATDVIAPYITQRHKITESVMRAAERGMRPFVLKQNVDTSVEGLPVINPDWLPRDKDTPRYIHVDLSQTGDRTGIAMAKPDGYMDIVDEHTGLCTRLPRVAVELAVSIQPSPAKPIDLPSVRAWILALKQVYGLNIAQVSYDGFDSRESVQLLRKAGIQAVGLSVDMTTAPYDYLRDALYDDRVDIIDNELLRIELSNLEFDENKNKVDHPPKGSKDIADAVAGSVYSAATARGIRHGVGSSAAPTSSQGEGEEDGQPSQPPRRGPTRRNVSRR